MKKRLGIILLSFFAISVYSQTNFRSGYIITNKGDTIYGKVDHRNERRMSKVCTFKTKELGKIRYSPYEIVAYKFENGRSFETFVVKGKPLFLELIVKGQISFYYYKYENGRYYFFRKGNSQLMPLEFDQRLVSFYSDGTNSDGKKYVFVGDTSKVVGEFLVKTQEFKQVLYDSLLDEPEIVADLEKITKPNHLEFINLTKRYSELKDPMQKVSVYNALKLEADYELTMSWISINYYKFRTDRQFLMFSFKGYIPFEEGKLYLGYGIQYAPVKLDYESYNLIKIPLSVRYKYPGKIVRPYAALGLNLYSVNGEGERDFIPSIIPSYMMGLAVNIYKNIQLSFNFEGDLLWNPYYNSSLTAPFSQTTSVGLMISL